MTQDQDEGQWRTTLRALVPAPDCVAILVRPGRAGWELPAVLAGSRVHEIEPGPAVPALRELLGFEPTLLRYVRSRSDRETRRSDVAFVLEPPPHGWKALPDWRWMDRKELSNSDLRSTVERALIEAQLEDLARSVPPDERPPWSRPGWQARARAWIESTLRARGEVPVELELVRMWGISCVFRATTPQGRRYFKAASRFVFGSDEARITEALAELFPDAVPRPLRVDPAESWLLLEDLGSERPSSDAQWAAALARFARMQIDSADRLEVLWKAGCPDRRLEVLAGQIEPLLADDVALSRLGDDDRDLLRRNERRLADVVAHRVRVLVPFLVVLLARITPGNASDGRHSGQRTGDGLGRADDGVASHLLSRDVQAGERVGRAPPPGGAEQGGERGRRETASPLRDQTLASRQDRAFGQTDSWNAERGVW